MGEIRVQSFDNVDKYRGYTGAVLAFFGILVKVYDEKKNDYYFVRMRDVVSGLVGQKLALSNKTRSLLEKRVVEIASSDSRLPLSSKKLEQLYQRYHKTGQTLTREEKIIQRVDELKE